MTSSRPGSRVTLRRVFRRLGSSSFYTNERQKPPVEGARRVDMVSCGAFRRMGHHNCSKLDGIMKTQGELEASICEGISRFELEYMGRGPKDIRAHLIDDL